MGDTVIPAEAVSELTSLLQRVEGATSDAGPDYCAPFVRQADVYTLCDHLRRVDGKTLADIDQGITRPDYRKKGTNRVVVKEHGHSTRGDGKLLRAEIYAAAMKHFEEKALANPKIFFSGSPPADACLLFFTKIPGWMPWWPLEGIDNAETNQKLSALLLNPTSLIQPASTSSSAPAIKGTLAYNKLLARGLVDFWQQEKGLNIRFSTEDDSSMGYRSIPWIVLKRAANCIETYFFATLCKMLGLKTFPIEDVQGKHIVIGLRLNPENPEDVTIVDLQKEEAAFDRPLSKDQWLEMSELELWANIDINEAYPSPKLKKGKDGLPFKKKKLAHAASLAPEYAPVFYHQGVLCEEGRERPCKKWFRATQRLSPDYQVFLQKKPSHPRLPRRKERLLLASF